MKFSNSQFSYFKAPIHNVVPERSINLKELFDRIKSAKYKDETHALREITDHKKNSYFKGDHFNYVTFSGQFSKRQEKHLLTHSNLICLDIDHIEDELETIKDKLQSDSDHLIGFFTSPNGNGLKVIYPIDYKSLPDQKVWYLAYSDHLRKVVDLPDLDVDEKCKDVSRACFLPFDPDAYLNPRLNEQGVRVIELKFEDSYESHENPNSKKTHNDELSFAKIFGAVQISHANKDDEDNFKYHLIEYEKKKGLYGRPRRMWILGAASRCRSFGMSYEATRDYLVKYIPDHPNSFSKDDPFDSNQHLFIPINDAFRRYPQQDSSEVWENAHFETPYLEDGVFENVPSYFTSISRVFENKRERDLVFLGTLVATSVLLPNVIGYYGGEEVESNLFLFISAPPASGKGKLTFSMRGVRKIQDEFREAFEEEKIIYESEMKLYEKGELDEKPQKPKKKRIIIPGNISSSSLIKTLETNNGRGLFFETEADTITNTILQDWGSYSDLLRKVFHHENIAQSRVTDDMDVEVSRPHCSVLLSGTPDQIPKLMQGINNGLFSRFLFYHYSHEFKWQDAFADAYDQNLKKGLRHLIEFAELVYPKLIDSEGLTFEFTSDQKNEFNTTLNSWTKEAMDMYGELARATVVRLGLVYFRISMILSVVRHWAYECQYQIDPNTVIVCNDIDFQSTKSIVATLKAHGLGLLSKYLKYKNLNQLKNGAQQNFYEVLPREFKTADYRSSADLIKLSHKTAEKYIQDYIQLKLLQRVEHGKYRKLVRGKEA